MMSVEHEASLHGTWREEMQTLGYAQAQDLIRRACRSVGADDRTADSLVAATLSAHRHGRHEVGLKHLLDYLEAFRAGRINGKAVPTVKKPLPAVIDVDLDGGIAQLGFDLGFNALIDSSKKLGVCIFRQRNGYSTGELGYYVRRLAENGIVALAFTNADAVVSPAEGLPRMFSTNPLAFGFPSTDRKRPLVIDQSTSATALINLRIAAERGEPLPVGFALDKRGEPTTSAAEALLGSLLPFGGRKGANMALLVELMSAGYAGGNWSLASPSFNAGASGTFNVALTIIAMSEPSDVERVDTYLAEIKSMGAYVPGKGAAHEDTLEIDADVMSRLRDFCIAGE